MLNMDSTGQSAVEVYVHESKTYNACCQTDEEKELQDLQWIRDLILKYKEDVPNLKLKLDHWLQHFANSETDFIKGSQQPSLNTLSFAVLVNYEVLGHLCDFLGRKGKIDESWELYHMIINGYRNVFGFNYHQNILSNLGIPSNMFSVENYRHATSLGEVICETLASKCGGLDAKLTLAVLYNIALDFISHAKPAQALIILQAILKKQSYSLGQANLETVKVENHIGQCLRLLSRYSDALELYIGVFKKLTILCGPNHDGTLEAQMHTAYLLFAVKNFEKALSVVQNVSTRRKSKFGLDHPQTVDADYLMACCYMEQHDYAEALPLFKSVRSRRSATLGPTNSETTEAHYNFARTLEFLQNYTKALPEYKSLYLLQVATCGAHHEDTYETLCRINICLTALKRDEEALDVCILILENQRERFGPNHINSRRAEVGIAMKMVKKGKYQEALRILEENYDAATEFEGGSPADASQTKKVIEVGRRQLKAMVIGEKLVCSICLVSMEIMDDNCHCPYACTHLFHAYCIAPWLINGKSCPECRRPVNFHTAALLQENDT